MDSLTAKNIGIEISSNVSAIDEYYRQIDQTDPPLDKTYQSNLPNLINQCYINIAKLAQYCIDQTNQQMPAAITNSELQSAGIIPRPEPAQEVDLSGTSTKAISS